MPKTFEKNNFIWLTVSLIGVMLSGALSEEIPSNLTLQLFEYSSIALLLLSLLSLKTDRVWGKRFLFIVGILLAVVIIRATTKIHVFEYFYLGVLVTFLLAAGWMVGQQVLLTGSVDINKIIGSIALYLILGLIWSIIYTILLEFLPHSFNGIDAQSWYDNMPDTTYFSFVTLTTLGYGDINPAGPIAQVLVILEAISGMFYLAIIVASLIGTLKHKS